MSKKIFTPLQAIAYLATELDSILASGSMGFNQAINRRLSKLMDTALNSTDDEAFQAWMQCHGIRSYTGKLYTADVLRPYLKACRDILVNKALPQGVISCTADTFLNEFDWWEPRDITVTEVMPDGCKRGTATVLETGGLHKLQLEWFMDVGEEAHAAGLPAMLNITGASVRLPQSFTIFENNQPADLLVMVQELDFSQGFSAAILNNVCEEPFPDD